MGVLNTELGLGLSRDADDYEAAATNPHNPNENITELNKPTSQKQQQSSFISSVTTDQASIAATAAAGTCSTSSNSRSPFLSENQYHHHHHSQYMQETKPKTELATASLLQLLPLIPASSSSSSQQNQQLQNHHQMQSLIISNNSCNPNSAASALDINKLPIASLASAPPSHQLKYPVSVYHHSPVSTAPAATAAISAYLNHHSYSHQSFQQAACKRERSSTSDGAEQTCEVSSRGSDDDGDGAGTAGSGHGTRKKLRLSKEQSNLLEECFREHSTLNPKQKTELARQLNLKPRQVEVWFQNRRARTKLKQTEVDCELLKRCCETLTEENRRLQKEVHELRALKLGSIPPSCYMATLSMCPSCQRLHTPTNNHSPTPPNVHNNKGTSSTSPSTQMNATPLLLPSSNHHSFLPTLHSAAC